MLITGGGAGLGEYGTKSYRACVNVDFCWLVGVEVGRDGCFSKGCLELLKCMLMAVRPFPWCIFLGELT